ncbi:hypothetical protein Pmani_005912 [Petrolisthes manimaculis]|uniref:non-specific serine/threonine protein kinase n=1 Tax=Petrolisthes manimaculis TaxID=1843537 RepID=A0AAE1UG81_9EUCA|nr:hypothetical protein Pmani_005912 [Petrolisthes manimaculis]
MGEAGAEPILKRLRQLNGMVSSCGVVGGLGQESGGATRHLLAREGLLDALLVLYQECNTEALKKEQIVSSFVDKCKEDRSNIHEMRKLRVNLNDFEQKKVIGKGNFGVVQVVREKATGNVYALKTLRKSDALSQQYVAFYEEERDIMAKATSSWITQLQYAFQDDQQLYLVMEFHPGGDLLSLLDRYDGTFSEDMACFYLAEIIMAVHTLHSMGYVHRDIKPDNILIDRCGHIKLADFGSAAKLTTSGVVRSKMPVGTPDYIAPEVLQSTSEKGNNVSYGIECDLWSIGIMAYEMLYGFTPFKDDKIVTTYSNIMNHKKTLKFDRGDEDCDTSAAAQELITGLLEESSHRLNHLALIQHKFFLHLDLNNIRNSPPPFVPVVNGVDDTSNFEEFENERRPPSVDSFRLRQGFTGRNLPFVGFTYNKTHPVAEETQSRNTTAVNISILDDALKEPSYLEAQLKAQRKENHELKLQLESLKGGEGERAMKLSECKLQKAECRVGYLEKEVQRLEQDMITKERNTAMYKRDLALERADRAKIENQTIELVRSMKNKWKAAEAERVEALATKINAYEEEVAALQSQKQEVGKAFLEREKDFKILVTKNEEFKKILKEQKERMNQLKKKDACSGDCQGVGDLKKQLQETSSKLVVEREKNSKGAERLEEARRESGKVEQAEREKMLMKQERFAVEDQKQQLQLRCSQLEEETAALKKQNQASKEMERADKKNKIEHMEEEVSKTRRECARLRQQLQDVSGQLNESVASLESLGSTRSLREEEQEAKLKQLEKELKTATSEKVNLQSQMTLLQAREGEHKTKINELEVLLAKLDETVQKLESKKSLSQVEKYQAKVECLETQLESLRSAQAQEKEKIKKLSEELRVAKQDLSDSKLDLRVAEREAKSTQDTIAYLREKSRDQRTQMQEKETALKTAGDVEADLHRSIEEGENKLKSCELDMERQKTEYQGIISDLEEKINSLEEVQKSVEHHQKQLRDTHQQIDSLKLEKRCLESEIKAREAAKEEVKHEKEAIRKELQEMQQKLNHSELLVSQLKQVCSDQDEELSIMEAQAETINQHEQEEEKLREEIEKLQGEVRAAKASANEEKSLKLFQERKVKEAEERLKVADEETDQQILHLNQQLKEAGETSLELHQQIESLDKELSESMSLLHSLERKLEEVQGERDLSQQESAGHIQHIHTLKNSNFKLTEGLEEAISKAEMYKSRIEEVERQISDQEAIFSDGKVKMRGTIDQQTKLIDFLQAKTDTKKKKNLRSKLFGRENKENGGGVWVTRQYRDLEDMLARERATNRHLEEQLARARAEVVALTTSGGNGDGKTVPSTPLTARTPLQSRTPMPAPSPFPMRTPQNRSSAETPSIQRKQRMRHNIPHRWQSSLQMQAGRCAGCLGSIPFARNAARCQECGVTAHNKCSLELPSTCGLPVQLAEHYSSGWTSDSPVRLPASSTVPSHQPMTTLQGWLKIPKTGKTCWECHYVKLEGDEVLVFDDEPEGNIKPTARLHLAQSGSSTSVISAVPKSELPNTSNVDLPYVLKIEIRASSVSGHSETLFLMTTNFEEKQQWVSTLETTIAKLPRESGKTSSKNEHIQTMCVLTLDNPSAIHPNTIVHITPTTVLMGASEGLYSFEVESDGKWKSRSRIEGLSDVHQVLVIKEAGLVLFIAGKSNLVFMQDLGTLRVTSEALQLTKPSMKVVQVEPLQGCHLLAAGTTKANQTFVCAAATDRISILVWVETEERLKVCQQYSTQEPCTCLHFTQVSLIVGAEKFYEIDLKTFEIDEFLEESDTTLAYAIYGSAQMASFPVAIMQISKPGNYEEYLLCFREFAVFVDACGQRTREHDVKFSRLPVAIVYRSPLLYVVHQSAIEVVVIRQDSFTKVSPDCDSDSDVAVPIRAATITLHSPCHLGPAATHEGILVLSSDSDKLEVLQVLANFPEDMELNSTWGSLPCFSLNQDDQDTASTCSANSVTSSEAETSGSQKRVHFKHGSRRSKRSKPHV